jgi:anti-anti-sigma regulatory factor
MKLNADLRHSERRQFRASVIEALCRGDRDVVVDCSEWRQLDLLMLSALVDCAELCAAQNAEFALDNLAADVRSRIVALSLGSRLGLRA